MGLTLLLTIACCILYRMGGADGYNTKFRDCGVPTCATLFICFNYFPHHISIVLYILALFFSFGFVFGALTTYWDFLFGYDNYWVHGFVVGLAMFPLVMVTGHWWMFALRCLILAIWSGVWSLIWKWDVAEEGGRFIPFIPTLYMIL